jgi:uracil phosphoribosyltransferase
MFILNQQLSIANHFLAELRDISIQKDRLRFRRNLERLGEVMAYEISKELDYRPQTIETPLMATQENLLLRQPIVIPILRAAMPFFQGVINYYDQADCGFVGAYRKEGEGDVEIQFGYMAAPDIDNKEVLLVDPMLATGKSFIKSIENLLKYGTPSKIHIVAVIASPEGVAYIQENLTVAHKFWLCSLDEGLNDKYYIMPGLGDAGDLAYGSKL